MSPGESVEVIPPTPKTVLLHEASCLNATIRDAMRVVMVQPVGILQTTEELGPHYSLSQHENATARFQAFLELVHSREAELAVAPEYFVPLQAFRELMADPALLRRDTLLVLPLESVSREDYFHLATLASENGIEVDQTKLAPTDGKYVNTVAVLYRGATDISLFLQAKTYEAREELHNLAVGEEFFVIEGKNVVCLVLLCSDVNYPAFHNTWVNAAAQKSGALMVHSQWNPKPDYYAHWGFWQSILDSQDGPKRIVFSINWGAGSQIMEGDSVKHQICHPRSRILRGKMLQETWRYPNRSGAGLQLHHKRIHNTLCEVWHLMSRTEHCEVLRIVRPYEAVPRQLSSDSRGVLDCEFFSLSKESPTTFSAAWPEDLKSRFWSCCEECNLQGAKWEHLKGITVCELESVFNACLLKKEDSWLKKDVDQRIPTAQLACQSGQICECDDSVPLCCQQREEWLQETAVFVKCLNLFRNNHSSERLFTTGKYPLNVLDDEGAPLGWLLNGRGVEEHFLRKKIKQILGDLLYSRTQLQLFIVGAAGTITVEGIIDQPTGRGGIQDPGETGQGITQTHHSAVISIEVLQDEGDRR